jgi:hypothetical protein
MDPPVAPALLHSIERIVVHLIKTFPRLPVQYYPFAIRAFFAVKARLLSRSCISSCDIRFE